MAGKRWFKWEFNGKIYYLLTLNSVIQETIEYLQYTQVAKGFPGGSDDKEFACNAGDLGSIPGLGRSPGEGHGNPLQYSCLEESIDRGAWKATVHGIAKCWT